MRYLLVLLFCVSCCFSQTSQQLRSRYGQPDVERFIVRPDITAEIEYGTDGALCQVVIEAQHPLVRKDQSIKNLRPETVTAIIEEIVPSNTWGRKVNELYEQMGCAYGETVEYENVVIDRGEDKCIPLKPERDSGARLTMKRKGCPPALIFRDESASQAK